MIKDIITLSEKTISEWQEPWGYAPDGAAAKISLSKTDWMRSLTHTLENWYEKSRGSLEMSVGEIILAYANMGALVESWMMFWLSVYDSDYSNNKHKRNGKNINVKDMSLIDLTTYFAETVWNTNNPPDTDGCYLRDLRLQYKATLDWIKKIEKYRNAIHCFKDRAIGTRDELVFDFVEYYNFLVLITDMLPDSPETYKGCI